MIFSSIPDFPVYSDHPNWHQGFQIQQPNHQQGTGNTEYSQLPPPPPQVGGGGGSVRPGSIVDQVRLAKLPLPEAGLKCPRCESTNTKFCYFNNYSLAQPRHFCKTCRRYWTRGGSLRNVPVGGGCRRNKRSKSNCSKSALNTEQKMGSNPTNGSPSSCSRGMNNSLLQQPPPQLSLMATLQNLSHYGGGSIGSNIGGFQQQIVPENGTGQTDMNFQIGGNTNILPGGGVDQWRFPFLAGFEPPTGLFPYQSGVEASSSMVGEGQNTTTSSGVAQVAPVKVEEKLGLNLSRQFFNISENNQYWSGNAWTADFSGLNSSSTNNLI